MGAIQQTLSGNNSDTLLASNFKGPHLGSPAKNLPLNHQAGVKELGKSVPEHKVRNGEHFEGGRLIASNKTNLTHAIVIMVAQNIDQPSRA